MRQVLLADIGNTTVCWQILEPGGQSSPLRRAPVAGAPGILVDAAVTASVDLVAAAVSAPERGRQVERALLSAGVRYLQVGRDVPVPIETEYYDPAEIGIDRLCNALAARERWGAPVISAAAGTCLTVEVVDDRGILVGGAIAAGVPALSEGIAAAAPHLAEAVRRAAAEPPGFPLGRSTEENLRLGLWLGAAGALDFLVSQAREVVGPTAPLVLTGGDARVLARLVGGEAHLHEDLTLWGIWLALEHDRE